MKTIRLILIVISLLFSQQFLSNTAQAAARTPKTKDVSIPTNQDRFQPFGITIHAGDSVRWVNKDGEEHVIKSDDFFNTVAEKRIDHFLVGTGANNGVPGTFTLQFRKPGLFIYYCSIHAELNSVHQPISKMGGDSAPMMGVVSVIP